MGNHCIDVACSNCGAWYCLRRCSDNKGPNEETKKVIQERVKKEGSIKYSGIRCDYCKTENLHKL